MRVFYNDMYNWEDYLGLFYSKLNKIKLFQIFEAGGDIGDNKMRSQTSNLKNAFKTTQDLVKRIQKKRGKSDSSLQNRQKEIDEALQLNHEPEALYKKRAGLNNKKRAELFTKYRPIVDLEYRDKLCPYPGKILMERVLKMKKERKRRRAEDKAGSKNKKKQRKCKGSAAIETEDEETATDDNKETTDNNEESTDNKEELIDVNEDELIQIAREERRKIVNKQMNIFEEQDKFPLMDDGSDGYDTDDKFEDMTLSEAAAYKRELIEKRKREEIKNFEQIPLKTDF